jgi:nucleoside-diphosphate-sugar epimerase
VSENQEKSSCRHDCDAKSQIAPRVAISGVTGYVGRDLARLMAASGCKILGLTRHGSPVTLGLPPSVLLHCIDGRTETLRELFGEFRPDVVIHLAALARRSHLSTDITPFFEANILLGTRLLEAMRNCGCSKFITAESVLQFSDTGEPRAMNLYAATKQAFAEILSYYTGAFGISAIALVLPTLYSEQETRPKLMTDLAAAIRSGSSVDLQAGDIKLDFVHIEDVARAFVRSYGILKDQMPESDSFSRYWISSGRNVTPLELVTLFERLGERKANIHWQHSRINERRVNPWRGPVLPGWAPRIDLEAGVRRMLSKAR